MTYAVKILTAFATEMTHQGQLHKLENLQAISELTDSLPYLPKLTDYFEVAGTHGAHLCFILGLLYTDVGSKFRLTAPTCRLLLYDVQIAVLYVLNALAIPA